MNAGYPYQLHPITTVPHCKHECRVLVPTISNYSSNILCRVPVSAKPITTVPSGKNVPLPAMPIIMVFQCEFIIIASSNECNLTVPIIFHYPSDNMCMIPKLAKFITTVPNGKNVSIPV
ncbi:hypothetical protein CDAR_456621 [Caerostris darwini]|uniref:Uncharacterized protein n=1 Tax=Caerostris darwini TaxID=1538125 RepID=A0AAV4RXP5_9ARAC|nr:hypothetical protein CDAR_456621 [Caerostris darwini]